MEMREEESSKRKETGKDGKGLKMGLVVLACDKSDRNKHTQINNRLIGKAWGMSFHSVRR